MPSAPKRPCTWPGCPALTDSGRCAQHRKQERQHYDKYQRNKDATRFYHSREWRMLSAQCKANANGLCAICLKTGRVAVGNQADHIIPREQGGQDVLDNLQWICSECHGRKSADEGSRWGR